MCTVHFHPSLPLSLFVGEFYSEVSLTSVSCNENCYTKKLTVNDFTVLGRLFCRPARNLTTVALLINAWGQMLRSFSYS